PRGQDRRAQPGRRCRRRRTGGRRAGGSGHGQSSWVPGAVFTSPQVAYLGMSEQEAKDAGHEVTVKVQKFSDVAYGWAMADDPGIVKLIADRHSRLLLGAHIV